MIAPSTRCGWALFKQYSGDGRSVFSCIKVCCPSTEVTCGCEVVLMPFADDVADIGGLPSATRQTESTEIPMFGGHSSTRASSRYASLSVRQKSWFQHDARRHTIERRPAVSEYDISRKVDWKCRADYMASPFAESFAYCLWFRMNNSTRYLVTAVVVLLQCVALCVRAVTNVCCAYVDAFAKLR